MRKLSKLWQALECVPGLEALPAEWQRLCGEDFPIIKTHLKPTEVLGASYPCPHPTDSDCPRRLKQYPDGSFWALCRHPHGLCSDLEVPRSEALVHEMDVPGLARQLAEPLRIELQPITLAAAGTWGLGVSTSRSHQGKLVFLLLYSRSVDLAHAVRYLTTTLWAYDHLCLFGRDLTNPTELRWHR